MSKWSLFFFCFFSFLVGNNLFSQDLNKVNKKNLLQTRGGLSVSTVFYDADGIENRRDPFYWQMKANLNFSVAGIAIPFSASFSQQENEFTQPFNQVGLSPKYKSVTVHAGYRSMSFSPYTLGGKTFLGGGIEIKPKDSWIQFSALYGRFARAVQTGGNNGNVAGIATYERWGYGGKVQMGSKKNLVAVSLFRGRDDENSIVADSSNAYIAPAENLVWSLFTKHKIAKKVTFDFEYAFSGYTMDTRNSNEVLDNFNYYNNLGAIFTPNATTQYNKAIVTNLTYAHEKYNLKFTYKRVDPEYLSMGTPFLNNDLENLTGALAWKMFEKKFGVTTTGGFQRNNLNGLKATNETRLAMGLNLTYTYKKKMNMSFNYANFKSDVRQEQFIEVDSLEFFQVTHNLSFRTNYKIGNSKTSKKDIIYSTNYQLATDSYDSQTTIINNNLGYKHAFKPIELTLFGSVNYNRSIFQGLETDSYGPTFNASKKLMKKKVVLKFTYSTLFRTANKLKQNSISNFRFSAKYNYNRHHGISLNASLLDRQTYEGTQPSFKEKTVTLQYTARF